MRHLTPDPLGPVETEFDRLREGRDISLESRNINDCWDVHEATSVWDEAEKKSKRVWTCLSSMIPEKEFKSKLPRSNVPVTVSEVFESANGRIAFQLLEDVHETRNEYTPHTDDW